MKSIFQFLAIPLLLLATSCDEKNSYSSTASIQEKKNLSGVTRLQIDGVFNLTITQSDQESIEVVGDESMIKKLLIDQDGDLLTLSMDENLEDNFFDKNELRINLSLKDLKELKYDGVGNVKTQGTFKVENIEVKEGDVITIDGSTGEVMLGEVKTINPDISGDFSEIMRWADEVRTLKIRANAETPLDSRTARGFGAEGIGLCRTEHMFFDEERILYVRQMILSKTREDRLKALEKILPFQRKDFVEIFTIMKGLPVTVRLLDPPLHEFLPKTEKEIDIVAKSLKIHSSEIKNRINYLHEENPMLGHRGCRLAISFPEIYEMQCRAIFEALYELQKQKVEAVIPEIMIPLVATEREIEILRAAPVA